MTEHKIDSATIASMRDHLEALHRTLDVIDGAQFIVRPAPIPPPEIKPQTFVLGPRSMGKLVRVIPMLRRTIIEAIKVSIIDFTVLQTERTHAEQVKAVSEGHSRTMHSKHLVQPDGFVHAIDLGAWVGGAVSWSEAYYADIAHAMDQAATKLGFAQHIRWGAAWDRVLADFGGNHDAYLAEARAYAARHAGSDLIDMPHFEWVA